MSGRLRDFSAGGDVRHTLQKVYHILGLSDESETANDVCLSSTRNAAMALSLDCNHRNIVIVVVELGSQFNRVTGSYDRRRYLCYPFRESFDFRRIVGLNAAYRNGERIDAAVEHVGKHPHSLEIATPAVSGSALNVSIPSATLVWSDCGRRIDRDSDNRPYSQSV